MSRKENIYIETDSYAQFNLKRIEQQTKNQYHIHIIALLCDNLQQSVERVTLKNGAEQKALNLTELTDDYHLVNHFLNNSGLSKKYCIDIFGGSGNRPVHLAAIEKGKIITAKQELMTKIWLDPCGPFCREIGKFLIRQHKKQSKDQAAKRAEIPRQKHKRKKGLGM